MAIEPLRASPSASRRLITPSKPPSRGSKLRETSRSGSTGVHADAVGDMIGELSRVLKQRSAELGVTEATHTWHADRDKAGR
eukprot:CAMPEP_0119091872 /NCGR_PEP_ID=MMETSP1178-20130426/157855_1 /TAXON_ID=33656 /ORGANISM="unid sp, Strain CCMP2000" /LENGTH=81 /DNA_ID=CAMNT_0007075411 /DNA_START=93 /DNA_END=335 /DNA_ORIENTATION=+